MMRTPPGLLVHPLVSQTALGVFGNARVVKAQPPSTRSAGDLLCSLLDDLEALADAKGGVGQPLHDKWCKTYKIAPPRGMFSAPKNWAA